MGTIPTQPVLMCKNISLGHYKYMHFWILVLHPSSQRHYSIVSALPCLKVSKQNKIMRWCRETRTKTPLCKCSIVLHYSSVIQCSDSWTWSCNHRRMSIPSIVQEVIEYKNIEHSSVSLSNSHTIIMWTSLGNKLQIWLW